MTEKKREEQAWRRAQKEITAIELEATFSPAYHASHYIVYRVLVRHINIYRSYQSCFPV